MSLMRRHQQRVHSQQLKHQQTDQQTELRKVEYKRWLSKMHKDRSAIKSLTDHDERNAQAAKVLDEYLHYLRSWLASGAEHQNDVLTQCVVWAVDGQRWDILFELADPAVANQRIGNLHWMQRDLVDFVSDTVLGFADTEHKAGQAISAPVWEILERVNAEDESQRWTINHVAKARYHKVCGILAAEQHEWEKALALFTRADELYSNIGVKGRIKTARIEVEAAETNLQVTEMLEKMRAASEDTDTKGSAPDQRTPPETEAK